MSTPLDTVTPSQDAIDAPLVLESEQSVTAVQALPVVDPQTNQIIYLSEADDFYFFDVPGEGNLTIYALGGNDNIQIDSVGATIYGQLGNDYLYAAMGLAYLDGGDGDDFLWADGGRSTLIGGDGNDILYAVNRGDPPSLDDPDPPPIPNLLYGGAGNDFLQVQPGLEPARLDGGDGDDVLVGGNTLIGGAGNDVIHPWLAPVHLVPVYIDGGDGFDTVNYDLSSGPVTLNLTDQNQNGGY
jgi:Ca2+-binding RTX toxin-like protein